MYLNELFIQTSSKKIMDCFVELPYLFDMIDIDNRINKNEKQIAKNKLIKLYEEELEKIKNIVPVKSNRVLIIEENYGEQLRYELGTFKITDIEKVKDAINVDNFYDFKNPLCSLCFDNRNEILGYIVSEYLIQKYTPELICAIALDEMTHFGIDETIRIEKQNEIIDSLNNIDINADNLISHEDLMLELGIEDNRSEEEKEKQKNEIIKKAEKRILNTIDTIKQVIKTL